MVSRTQANILAKVPAAGKKQKKGTEKEIVEVAPVVAPVVESQEQENKPVNVETVEIKKYRYGSRNKNVPTEEKSVSDVPTEENKVIPTSIPSEQEINVSFSDKLGITKHVKKYRRKPITKVENVQNYKTIEERLAKETDELMNEDEETLKHISLRSRDIIKELKVKNANLSIDLGALIDESQKNLIEKDDNERFTHYDSLVVQKKITKEWCEQLKLNYPKAVFIYRTNAPTGKKSRRGKNSVTVGWQKKGTADTRESFSSRDLHKFAKELGLDSHDVSYLETLFAKLDNPQIKGSERVDVEFEIAQLVNFSTNFRKVQGSAYDIRELFHTQYINSVNRKIESNSVRITYYAARIKLIDLIMSKRADESIDREIQLLADTLKTTPEKLKSLMPVFK